MFSNKKLRASEKKNYKCREKGFACTQLKLIFRFNDYFHGESLDSMEGGTKLTG